MTLKSCLAVGVFAVFTLFGVAAAQDSPPAIEGAKVVTPSEAKSAIDAGAPSFDVRRKATFLEGRLPKAKSIAQFVNAKEKTVDVEAFTIEKSAPFVIYGHGIDGWSAVYAVESAVKAGFTKVLWMREGYSGWVKAGLPTEQ